MSASKFLRNVTRVLGQRSSWGGGFQPVGFSLLISKKTNKSNARNEWQE